MYCKCGYANEMVKRQEKQEGQAVGETTEYLHCESCGRNHVLPDHRQKTWEKNKKLVIPF